MFHLSLPGLTATSTYAYGAGLSTLVCNQTIYLRNMFKQCLNTFSLISLNYLFILAIIISSVVGPLLLILIAIVITIAIVIYSVTKRQKNSGDSIEMNKNPLYDEITSVLNKNYDDTNMYI